MAVDWSLLEAAQRASSLLIAAGYVSVTVAIGRVVRRHRPDAWRGLLGWGIAGIAVTLGDHFLGHLLTATLAHDETVLFRALAIQVLVLGVAHFALMLLLARCLVRLAQPMKPVEVRGAPPYR